MSSSELRETREAIVLEHFRAENAHDVDGVLATFAQPHYEMMHLGRTHDGADEVRQLLASLFGGMPDVHAEPGTLRHLEDGIFVEAVTTGTHTGFFAGVPPTGKRIETRSACVFEFEGEDLIAEKVYLDLATVLRQLGRLPELPSNVQRPAAAGSAPEGDRPA